MNYKLFGNIHMVSVSNVTMNDYAVGSADMTLSDTFCLIVCLNICQIFLYIFKITEPL